jgi:predicted nucleic acid-binding Zn ribbon protein
MDKAGDLLGRVARRLGHSQAPIAWLASSWLRIVGKTVAAHTRPLRCQDGCLEVAADGKVWQGQLECMAGDFCSQINRAWGGALVREVRFSTAKRAPVPPPGASNSGADAPRRAIPYELDNDHLPFIRRRK